MLEIIKSIKIEKEIFKYLSFEKKLDILRYNKKLQKKFFININYYKIFCKRYIIFEENGKGKEYSNNNDDLIFEGEYKNKKRNGKGKEYDRIGNILFEGEYLNGERNGKGKEFFYDGRLKFEGEYLNGFKWNGKGYNINNNMVYKLNDGKGFIIIYNNYNKLLSFEGEYLNGLSNGKGKEYNIKGNIEFEGEFLNGKRNGYGKEYYLDGKIKFEGEYKKGFKLNGKFYDKNNFIIYELKNGKLLGKNKNNSDEKLTFDDKDLFGFNKGKEYYPNGNLKFEGEYTNGKRNGIGKEYDYKGNLIIECEYTNGKRNGKFKEYYTDGKVKFEGEYLNGFKWKGKEYDMENKLILYITNFYMN